MSSFHDCQDLEAQGVQQLREYITRHANGCQFVFNEKGLRSRELQQFGDFIATDDTGKQYCVELKIERANTHGNLFLETWSNREWWTPGWLYTSKADTLWYYFLAERVLYTMDIETLRKWAFGFGDGDGQIEKFPQKRQRKYTQRNDTWGRCVPIEVLERDVAITRYMLPADPAKPIEVRGAA